MIEKLNDNGIYTYHIDPELRGIHQLVSHLYFVKTLTENKHIRCRIVCDIEKYKTDMIFEKGVDAANYIINNIIKKEIVALYENGKDIIVRSIELTDDLSNLNLLKEYTAVIAYDDIFNVVTRLIYRGKILLSAIDINVIRATLDDFMRNRKIFDSILETLPSADAGVEHEKNMFLDNIYCKISKGDIYGKTNKDNVQ